MKIIGAFIGILTLAQAAPLEDELHKLSAQYEQLEGYQTSYEIQTPNGTSGSFKVGVDFASGWAYAKQKIQDKDGKILQDSQQWSTEEGHIIVKSGAELIVFEGFDQLSERFGKLSTLILNNNEAPLLRIAISSHITAKGGEFGISLGKNEPGWLKGITELSSIKDQKAHLDWGENGSIIVDQKTGLLLSQEIIVEKGKRVMKATDSKINPGAEAISSLFDLKIENAARRDLAEMGMSKKLLRDTCNKIITLFRDDKDAQLAPYLEKIEDGLVEFLKEEPLKKAPLTPEAKLFGAFDTIIEKIQIAAVEKGHQLAPKVIIADPNIKKKIEETITKTIRDRNIPHLEQALLADLLGGELTARGRGEIEARKKLRALLEKCYHRAFTSRALDLYLKQL